MVIRMRELIVQVCDLGKTTEKKNIRSTDLFRPQHVFILFVQQKEKKYTQKGMHGALSIRIG